MDSRGIAEPCCTNVLGLQKWFEETIQAQEDQYQFRSEVLEVCESHNLCSLDCMIEKIVVWSF